MNVSLFKTNVPLSTAKVTLKFSRHTFVNELGKVVINSAFPAFWGDPDFDKVAAAKKMKADRVFIIKDGPARRRFAGDFTLSRGRYYSVCNDELGNDRGTITRELLAYHEGSAGHLMLYDLILPDQKDVFEKYGIDSPAAYVIELYSTPEHPSPIVLELINEGLITTKDGEVPKTFPIFMPLDIRTETIENVFDLRQLNTQQWLAKFLPKGDDAFSKNADPVGSFVELLPDLTTHERGGSDFTDALGNYLRLKGANGMIFPSARCDIRCDFVNGELSNFQGFSFVDYRDLVRPISDSFFDISPWFNRVLDGVTIHTAPENTQYVHSWRMQGKEAAEDEHRERRTNEFYSNQES